MDILSDEEVVNNLDSLLTNASETIDIIISRLYSLGWQPKDDMSTSLFAQALFIKYYSIIREHEDITVQDALKISYGNTLTHPVITRWLSRKGVSGLDRMAGVR